jgi:hypothetical protein
MRQRVARIAAVPVASLVSRHDATPCVSLVRPGSYGLYRGRSDRIAARSPIWAPRDRRRQITDADVEGLRRRPLLASLPRNESSAPLVIDNDAEKKHRRVSCLLRPRSATSTLDLRVVVTGAHNVTM